MVEHGELNSVSMASESGLIKDPFVSLLREHKPITKISMYLV